MESGGPYEQGDEVFKCTRCGAETAPEKGWDGEPEPHHCTPDCRMHHGDWTYGRGGSGYRENFDRIFPDAPGAGL